MKNQNLPAIEKQTFTDPVTKRTIHQLTTEGLNVSPYFNSYAWTPQGDWIFFLSEREGESWVMGCEIESGRLRKLAGPFETEPHEQRVYWPSLNAIPCARAVTFAQGQNLWRAELEGDGPAELLTELPGIACGDTDISGDGQWHVISICKMPDEARNENVGWNVDPLLERYDISCDIIRVNLNNGAIETLWNEKNAVVDHISVNPVDQDLIMYCHEGGNASQFGRIYLRQLGESTSRQIRDQRSGKVKVTHERWFPDGKHIAYHGSYAGTTPCPYVGIFDLDRDLPNEYLLDDPRQQVWHCSPSPDGKRMVMDIRDGSVPYLDLPETLKGLFLLNPNPATGMCDVEQLCSIHSQDVQLPRQQWRENDPIWFPDGTKVLFRAACKDSVQIYVVEV